MVEQRIIQKKSNIIGINKLCDNFDIWILLFNDVVFENSLGIK